jgi:hypothetical protein
MTVPAAMWMFSTFRGPERPVTKAIATAATKSQ